MPDHASQLKQAFEAILKELSGKSPVRSDAEYIAIAHRFRRSGRPNWAIKTLDRILTRGATDPNAWFVLALSHRDLQEMEPAYIAICEAAKRAPKRADIAFLKAQTAYETWRPATTLFKKALVLSPQNLDLVKNAALALVSEEKSERGIELLQHSLIENPLWLEGHRQLASIKTVMGYSSADASYAAAAKLNPDHEGVRLGWFHLFAQAKDWERAKKILAEAADTVKTSAAFKKAAIFLRTETGETLDEAELSELASADEDAGFDLCRVRYYLRQNLPDRAEQIAQAYVGTHHQRMFWPYLSICWRLLNDPRFEWLEGDGQFISSTSLPFSANDLEQLATVLRQLHMHQQPYLEQSVRGGTQTDRNLFFNPQPEIQDLRKKIQHALEAYSSQLPAPTKEVHPLLSICPDRFSFSGAWSVRLKRQGFHTTHTHVLGWVSSALYIRVPDENELGPAPSGYLSFGRPPAELETGLSSFQSVKPEPAKLILFPSYTWHGTEPFSDGERLTVAFDVVPG
ncbi:MAG: putative 2OG-Fe(II) oxygenase [Hyphomonas sp.]|nr:putative 2OG-Fe(II) oxygenase [Hyphomonas sp.]